MIRDAKRDRFRHFPCAIHQFRPTGVHVFAHPVHPCILGVGLVVVINSLSTGGDRFVRGATNDTPYSGSNSVNCCSSPVVRAGAVCRNVSFSASATGSNTAFNRSANNAW